MAENHGACTGPNRWLAAGDVARGADYDRRFADLEATGADVHGEARFVASLGPASVLDAGCGTGRVAVELDRQGIEVVGVDLDGAMLAAARAKAPHLCWVEADLAELALGRTFDAVVLAGNVVLFLAPGSEGAVLERLVAHLGAGGVLVAGFSLGRAHLTLADYDRLATGRGLELVERWATWDRQPYRAGATYALSVHRRTA